jgi:SNF2 family DNA or RNA helicase
MIKNYKHQEDIFQRSKDAEYYALFCEPGTGKTRIVIRTLEHQFTKGMISGAVIVTTKGIVGNWVYGELPKHSEDPYAAYLWTGTHKPEIFKTALVTDRLCYFICNIDSLLSDSQMRRIEEFAKVHKKFAFVIDESTTVKNIKAARTKRALNIAKYAKTRRIMSGTPIVQSPLDVFSQCEILKRGLLGHKSIYSFKGQYAVVKPMRFGIRSFDKIVGFRDLDKLTAMLQSFGSIVKKEDCLDLPPKIYQTIYVPLSNEQLHAYEELKEKAVLYLQGNEVTAVNALAMIVRLLQICCGQLKIGEGRYISIENNRLAALRDLIDESPNKVIVWTSFTNTANDIMKLLGDEAIHLSSDLNVAEREDVLNEFRGGSPKVLVANPASAGHGITLVEASTVIYYSNSYNLEHRLQSEDRTHRIGQTKPVLYIDLVAPDTIEGAVLEALKNKKAIADEVITSKALLKLLTSEEYCNEPA